MINPEITSTFGYKYWRLSNISMLTNNNSGDYWVFKLHFLTKSGVLADNPLKASAESVATGSPGNLLNDDQSTYMVSAKNKHNIWWFQYEFENPEWVTDVVFRGGVNWGQEWQTADLECSLDGVTWFKFYTIEPRIPAGKNIDGICTIPPEYILKTADKKEFTYWRISNIINRRKDQTYRSVGGIKFITKTGEISDNPTLGFSESSYSQETLPGNAFDGLNSTYTLSSSLEDGTNTEIHGSSWWIGYRFTGPVEIDSIKISMRHDMEKEDYKYGEDFLGQEWVSFTVDGSDDGISWDTVFSCSDPKIFRNDTSSHTYKIREVKKIQAHWWRVTNIRNRLSKYANGQVAFLRFNNLQGLVSNVPEKGFSRDYPSDHLEDRVWNTAITKRPSPYAAAAFDDDPKSAAYSYNSTPGWWWVGYEFEEPVEVTSLDIQMYQGMQTDYGMEWQTANIEYSLDGFEWHDYGYIHPNISSMDLSVHSDVPVLFKNLNNFEYFNESVSEKFKFWRCSNINTLPSYTNSSFDISGSILKFINTENLNLVNKENSFSTSSATAEIGKGVPSNGFDNSPLTWFHSQYPEGLNNILKNYENYSIGCMFEEPVEVVKIGYKPRPDMDINWGQEWQTCNIEYSPNGFDWFQKGYCDFNIKRLSSEYVEKDIQPTDALDSFRYWRISKVFNRGSTTYPQFTGYNQGFSGWELRFNTLTGERSNDSSRGYSNGSWDASWTPDRAFDGNIQSNAGGFHQKKDNDSQFYIAYRFSTPQHVNSISILPRRDSDLPHQSWLLAHIEASHDGVNWEFRGYANLNCGSNTRFYTSRLESRSLFDLLNSSVLTSTIKNLNVHNPKSDGIYKGQVLELNEPVVKQVALYERNTRKLVAIVWSDSEGFYEFKNLNQNKSYYVHAIDNNKIYNAVTKDMVDLRINSEYK